jgi:polysaccharide biosynthesis PFTS motif protein
MLNRNKVTPTLSNEMFLYWKIILFYSKLLKGDKLEAVALDQLLNYLYQNSFSMIRFMRYQIKIWLKMIFYCLLCFSPRKFRSNKDVSIVYGLSNEQIFKSGTTIDLLNFLQSSQVGIPVENVIYIEQRNYFPHKSDYGTIKLVNDVNLYLYLDYLKFSDRLRVLFLMCKRYFTYFRYSLSVPNFFLIGVSYVIDEIVLSFVSKNSLIRVSNVVTTPSSIMNSDYIFQYYKTFGKRTMIWYSANAIPINYRNQNLKRAIVDSNIYKYISIDEHLVWTEDHKKYLSSVLVAGTSIKVCGSLMFYQPKTTPKSFKIYDLLIFDITPYNENKISYTSEYSDTFNSIYNRTHAMKFVEDILWVKDEVSLRHNLSLKLALKPKRAYNSAHDKIYINFIDSLAKTKQLELIYPETNLYELVNRSRICISYPFTGTAIIAEELNIPSLYYLSSDILDTYTKVHGIRFVDEKIILLEYVETQLIGQLR